MTSIPLSIERDRRLKAAPFGLLLLLWGLGAGPLAHAVLAHGEPQLHQSGDSGWLHHPDGERSSAPHSGQGGSSHHHAPGTLEHLQLTIAQGAVVLTVATVFVAFAVKEFTTWRAPALSRWRLPEVPGAP